MCFVDTSFIPELKVDITYQDLLEFLHLYHDQVQEKRKQNGGRSHHTNNRLKLQYRRNERQLCIGDRSTASQAGKVATR